MHDLEFHLMYNARVSNRSHLPQITKSISLSNTFGHLLPTFCDLYGPACGVLRPLIRFIAPKYALALCHAEQEKERQANNLTFLHLCASTVRLKELITRPLARRLWGWLNSCVGSIHRTLPKEDHWRPITHNCIHSLEADCLWRTCASHDRCTGISYTIHLPGG